MGYNHSKYMKEYSARLRRAVIAFLGGKCKCGFSDWRALQIDHLDRDGYTKKATGRKTTGRSQTYKDRGVKLYSAILQGTYKRRVQLLCANCNWIKRFENNEHH